MLLIILSYCLYCVSATKYDTKTTNNVTFTQWISLVVSRGIYVVLLSLIIICVLISAYRNRKTGRRIRNEIERTRKSILSDDLEDNNWIANLWKGPQMFSLQGNDLLSRNKKPLLELSDFDSDAEGLKDKLKEAEVAINAVKEELDIARKARLELESTMEVLERDKSSTDEELRKTKLNTSLELEEMKKEINILQRQLGQAQIDKLQLTKDLEALTRESRIADSALRDQQNLSTRLDEAKSEIKQLKEVMGSMKAERDSAVKVASELVTKAKGVTKESLEGRKLIRSFLETASKTSNFSTGLIGDGPTLDSPRSEWQHSSDESRENTNNLGDADIYEDEKDEDGQLRIRVDDSNIMADGNSTEDSSSSRLVTNSPEFRAFLQATFRLSSIGERNN
uniref:Putative unconventional myosin-xviiia n=1 Tax=Panstrongylus lignarius TaxID=156445 RepID=A0A224XPY6_9HEMI